MFCRHPFKYLVVQKDLTSKPNPINDTDDVRALGVTYTDISYHLHCIKCGKDDLTIKYASCSEGDD